MTDSVAAPKPNWGRAAGSVLLVSIPLWWTGLQAWASAQYGYLDLEVTGPSPLMWILLIAGAGLSLVTGFVPRQEIPALNLGAGGAFMLAVVALAAVNVAYGASDGISTSGWLLALLSAGQVILFLAAIFVLPSRRW